MFKSPLIGLILALSAIALFTTLGPEEMTLGTNVRVVYLHGAWVWAALVVFLLAALAGLVGLLTRRESLHLWSRALGRTGLVFWITYLPLSLWAMQANWNGLFLAEPRWRFAAIFALGGLVLQVGLALMEDPAWASAANLAYWLALVFALRNTEEVMHPGSPIFSSDALRIQVYFIGLGLLVLVAAWQVARWWYHFDRTRIKVENR